MLKTANQYNNPQFRKAIEDLAKLQFAHFWGGSDGLKPAIAEVEQKIAFEDIFYSEAELEEKKRKEQETANAVAVISEQERIVAEKEYKSFFKEGTVFDVKKVGEVENYLEKYFDHMKPHARAYLGEQVLKNSTPEGLEEALAKPNTREAINEHMDLKNSVEVLLKRDGEVRKIFDTNLIEATNDIELKPEVKKQIDSALKSGDKEALYQIAKKHFPKDLQDQIIKQAKKAELELRMQRNPEMANKAIEIAMPKVDAKSQEKLKEMQNEINSQSSEKLDLNKAKEVTNILQENGVKKEVTEEIKDEAARQEFEKSQQKQPEKKLSERSTVGSEKLQAAVEKLKDSGVMQVASADRQQTSAEIPTDQSVQGRQVGIAAA